MKLTFKTLIDNDLPQVFSLMNRELLEKISPPALLFKIISYQGQQVKDQFEFHLGPPGLKQKWTGIIIDRFESEHECYFIDQGIDLPLPLTAWKHKHHFIKENQSTWLIDEIEFSAGPLTPALIPLFSMMFLWRKPFYRKYLQRRG